MVNVKPVQLGTNTRMSFAKINEVLDMPNLIEVQKNSYEWFLKQGLKEVFQDVSAITDYTGNLILDFVDYRLEDEPKYSVAECKERDVTFAAPLRVTARLLNKESGEVKEQEIFMGDFPLMTESGTFVINGAERVIVSQLVRSPGVYFNDSYDKTGKKLYTSTINPNRGAWLEYETDSNDFFYVRIDKNRKIPITTFLRALLRVRDDVKTEDINEDYNLGLTSSLGSDQEIYDILGEDERIMATVKNKDATKNGDEALLEVYRKLRPGEPPTIESAVKHVIPLLFDEHRYDLSKVGRYKYNKKLQLQTRLAGQTLAEPVIDQLTGELIADKDVKVTRELAEKIQRAGVDTAYVYVNEGDKVVKIISNGMVELSDFVEGVDKEACGVYEKVRLKILIDILDKTSTPEERTQMIKERINELIPKHVIKDDIYASINYMNNLVYGIGTVDDIDHLGNRRIRTVGELLQNQFRIGFSRMERVIRERMTMQAQDMDVITPQALINIRPVVASIKEFFGSSPLSQFMDQTNPLAELTHKRRLSALGPGGLSRDRAGFEVRDVHYSHYGRMCPIETPEGPNIGLISYLASFARLNVYGFIEAPFRKVDKATGKVLDEVEYMTADIEDEYVVAQANEPLTEDGRFARKRVNARWRDEILETERENVDYMDVSPKMVVSVATSMIPFLENDDANRALMGSNMQRQAVPLLRTSAPLVGTGIEHIVARDSGVCVVARRDGVVDLVDAARIVVKADSSPDEPGSEVDIYNLIKYQRSNQNTCINQKPIVKKGDRVKKGDVIGDGPATETGDLALGQNIVVAFTPWQGYNFEDSILLNERLVKEDVFTSIHIEEFECVARDTKLGKEEITRDIPNVGDEALRDLDEAGIIRIGAEVKPGDVLVGKITPKGETQLSPEEKLLRAIFGEKAGDVRDSSLRVPPGVSGTIINAKVFSRKGVDKDDRAKDIEAHEEQKLLKDQNDEIKILEDSAYARVRALLRGQVSAGRLADEQNKTLIKRGDELTDELLDAVPYRYWIDISLAKSSAEVAESVKKILEAFEEQKSAVKLVFGEKISRLKKGDELPPGVIKMVKVYVAIKRKLSVGDKMAGRHGNKGVVSRILPEEDMPYMADGRPVDMVLNPLGVPSRMNIGQILETHLGWAARSLGEQLNSFVEENYGPAALRTELKKLYDTVEFAQFIDKVGDEDVVALCQKLNRGIHVATPVFDGAHEAEIDTLMAEGHQNVSGQQTLFDGRTGEPFDQDVTVGVMYMLKLHHLVDEKIHARSIGPYSLVTQQPLGGKAQFGGQRLGEMEVWAMEAYGAAYSLQEFLTVKSDDVVGRTRMYEAIVKGENVLESGLPESFNVLIKELQSLGLDVELLEAVPVAEAPAPSPKAKSGALN